MTNFESTQEYALNSDHRDDLGLFRNLFNIPTRNGNEVIYLCGNSLGLQPKSAKEYIETEYKAWTDYGIEGHFNGKRPWMPYHKNFKSVLASLVGANENEVVAMNSITVNLHLMMVSFYRPEGKRYKILCESDAFPSDQYALETQARFHGYNPEDAIVEIQPRNGEHLLRHEDIIKAIDNLKDELALTMIGGVQYYTGQYFDLRSITHSTHKAGGVVGFDLAHAVGNLPLKLNEWGVDFAVWCSYKYMNSGPGSVGGAFINEKHHSADLQQFAGWWGHNEEERFLMEKGFNPIHGADRWQLSNAPVFNMASHLAALEIFESACIDRLRKKSLCLTAYMEYLINLDGDERLEIITPKNPDHRGCQLSLFLHGGGRELFNRISARGVIADWRAPNVIRVAPVPLYNSFHDVYKFVAILKEELNR